MNLQEKRIKEHEKYMWLKENSKEYGSSFHGEKITDYILTKKDEIGVIADVGTGRGEFSKWAADNLCNDVYGFDFAFEPYEKNLDEKITYKNCFAHELPLTDKQVDMLTAFDMLEHLVEEDVENVFREFERVTKKYFIFSIATFDSTSYRDQVGTLHPTVKNLDWWHNKLSEFGDIDRYKGYTIVKLKQ